MTRIAPFTCKTAPVGLVLGLLVVLSATACAADSLREAPSELVGRWITDHPTYAGRFFEITPSSLTIGSGVEPPTRHTIVRVEQERSEDGLQLVTLVYLNESRDTIRFPLAYDPDSPGRVWPRHQSGVVWRRTEPGR